MCPITAIAFTLDGMSAEEKSKYYRAKQQKAFHSKLTDFYISKTVAAHPIEEVRVKAALPCWSRQEISQAANHQFYFSEVASFQDLCTMSNENFKQMSVHPDTLITEYSLQQENGILDSLRGMPHFKQHFTPDVYVKKEIPLSIYSRNVYNWKLVCEQESGRTLADAIEII